MEQIYTIKYDIEYKTGRNYEDFISDELICDFESDMENGEYKEWLKKFPEEVNVIFAKHITSASWSVDEEVIADYVKHGVNFQFESREYGELPTLMDFLAEWRDIGLMAKLLEAGAKIEDRFDFVCSTVMGHRHGDEIEPFDRVKEIVQLINLTDDEKKDFKNKLYDYGIEKEFHDNLEILFK